MEFFVDMKQAQCLIVFILMKKHNNRFIFVIERPIGNMYILARKIDYHTHKALFEN